MSDNYDFRPPDDPIAGTTILCIIDGCNRAVAVSASVVSSSVTGGWVAETAKELAHRLGWTSDGSWLCPAHSPEEPETRTIRSASGTARLPPPHTLADRVADLERMIERIEDHFAGVPSMAYVGAVEGAVNLLVEATDGDRQRIQRHDQRLAAIEGTRLPGILRRLVTLENFLPGVLVRGSDGSPAVLWTDQDPPRHARGAYGGQVPE